MMALVVAVGEQPTGRKWKQSFPGCVGDGLEFELDLSGFLYGDLGRAGHKVAPIPQC
jgi:hypothetical protein